LEDTGVGGRIILKWIYEKWDGGIVWLYLAEERNSWRDVVKAVMNLCKICHGTDHEDPEGKWTLALLFL
jgi:hypothetical protein